MMEEVSISGEEAEEFDLYDGKPSGERWAPVGASELDDDARFESIHDDLCGHPESIRTKDLEEQLDVVNSSLIALTTHFAQVQFRLRQIVDAPVHNKDSLLKDLEEFAFRGIPEVKAVHPQRRDDASEGPDGEDHEERMSQQREKQRELIKQLKQQLEDLEKYAYETGEAGLPQSVLLERQKILIDQLKGKLNLKVDDIESLTPEDLKKEVDEAIGQLVNPLKVKEQLVCQLKTQISDLERFVEFLQAEVGSENTVFPSFKCSCHSKVHTETCDLSRKTQKKQAWKARQKELDEQEDKIREKTLNIMKKAAMLLQIFAVSQFGCGQDVFHKNTMKKNMKVNHWGDLRARLEVAVAHVSELMLESSESPSACESEDYASDTEGAPIVMCNARVTTAVRKKLAMAVKDLMEHGLMQLSQNMSLVPFIGCFPSRGPAVKNKQIHAWELILAYYELKNGDSYNSTPARRLSQSFNLELVGGVAVSNKQQMLSTIGNIIGSHSRYKRSFDAHFKAFVCAGLNNKRLVSWLRLIFRCQPIIEAYYQPWSYVCKTGFEDSLRSLEKLQEFDFELPIDLAVRQFQNIKDAF